MTKNQDYTIHWKILSSIARASCENFQFSAFCVEKLSSDFLILCVWCKKVWGAYNNKSLQRILGKSRGINSQVRLCSWHKLNLHQRLLTIYYCEDWEEKSLNKLKLSCPKLSMIAFTFLKEQTSTFIYPSSSFPFSHFPIVAYFDIVGIEILTGIKPISIPPLLQNWASGQPNLPAKGKIANISSFFSLFSQPSSQQFLPAHIMIDNKNNLMLPAAS